MKYRKKPIEIEAIQFKDFNISTIVECLEFMGKDTTVHSIVESAAFHEYCSMVKKQKGLIIKTLEGEMKASIGDYIIKGVNGEFYPCKPDIFEKTYEKVEG